MATTESKLAAFRERKKEEKSSHKDETSKKKRDKGESKSVNSDNLLKAGAISPQSETEGPPFLGLRPGNRFFNVLTGQELRDLRTVFDAFDGKSCGTINRYEMQKALTALGFRVSEQEIQEAVSDMGIRNGKIEFQHFLSVVVDRQGDARDTHEEIIQVFRMLDHSGRGKITFEDLKKACLDAGETLLTEKDLSDMIYEADKDGDDAVSQAEFIQIMMKTNLFQ